MVDTEWVTDVAAVEEWYHFEPAIGNVDLKDVDTIISRRTSAAFVVVLAVLEQQWWQTLLSRLHLSLRLDTVWVPHRWQVHRGRALSLLRLAASLLVALLANSTAGPLVNTLYLLDSVLRLVPILLWVPGTVRAIQEDHSTAGLPRLLSHRPVTVPHLLLALKTDQLIAVLRTEAWT